MDIDCTHIKDKNTIKELTDLEDGDFVAPFRQDHSRGKAAGSGADDRDVLFHLLLSFLSTAQCAGKIVHSSMRTMVIIVNYRTPASAATLRAKRFFG